MRAHFRLQGLLLREEGKERDVWCGVAWRGAAAWLLYSYPPAQGAHYIATRRAQQAEGIDGKREQALALRLRRSVRSVAVKYYVEVDERS